MSDPVVQKPPRPDTWRVETLASRKDLQFAFSDGDDPLLLVQTGLMPPMPEYGHDDWVGEEEVLVIHKLLKMKLVTKTIGFDDEPIFFNEYKRLTERQRADYNAGRLKLD
ncbi:hypothetical protein LOC67_22650 [Stieleria sp. JC731]|uniref:hypothetical protein n=1 Tax=Stieleria sp. JC731 TaxID=2894195 RepID=UPI001E2DF4E2|nr:hypothetical protein [Stieleria sp. JC731]MCC9603359.1 hypothetical protein [Stieleria sp. JC731]